MATRIPPDFINELLARLDIVSVIKAANIDLRKTGSNYSARCPFHTEKTPSFTVSSTKQLYHCFGCGASGSAIGFVMNYERMEFVEAVETLAGQVGMEVPRESSGFVHNTHSNLYDLLQKAAQFYHAQLQKMPQAKLAQTYLQQRGLNTQIIQQFNIGFALPGWNNLINYLHKDFKAEDFLAAGLVVQKDNGDLYDRFRNRIMFPIRDRRGRVIAFGGRVLGDDTPKYLNSPETPVFHKSQELFGWYEAQTANRNFTQMLVVEGYLDVISLAQQGINYAVATLGTAITSEHIQRLFRACSEVVFCFDGDRAGWEAAWRALETTLAIIQDGWQARFMFLPEGEDPDTLVRAIGKEIYEKKIGEAISLSEFFFDHLSAQINLETIDGRVRFAKLAMPYLQKMPICMTQAMLLEELAKQVGMPVEKLKEYTPAYLQQNKRDQIKQQQQNRPLSLTRLAITLLVQHPEIIHHAELRELPDNNSAEINLLNSLMALLKEHPHLNTAALLEYWRDQPEGDYLIKLANMELMIPASGIIAEFNDILKRLQHQANEYLIEQLMKKSSQEGLSLEEKMQLQSLLREAKG